MSTIIDKRIAVRVTSTTESPYFIKPHTQIAEFSVVTPEQSKHIKPVDMAILSMIPQDDPDLTAYINELLGTRKPEQQDNTFWFPLAENPGKLEDHTPIQTRILKELNELKDKEKFNPQETTESRTKFLKRLIALIRFLQKWKNRQLKIFWSNTMTYSPDTEWILG